jgi:hypothetical protein
MRYEPEDFDGASQVCLAWIQHFQKKGTIDAVDLKQAFADIANSFEQSLEEKKEASVGEFPRTIILRNISSASTWG